MAKHKIEIGKYIIGDIVGTLDTNANGEICVFANDEEKEIMSILNLALGSDIKISFSTPTDDEIE